MSEFASRVAVVTGAASGLGAAMARAFAAEGMRIVVGDIDESGAGAVAAELVAGGADAVAARVDVGDPRTIDALAVHARERFGGCDLLAANVGVQHIASFDAMTRDEFAWLIETNVVGTADTVRSFLPLLRESDDAHIVFTGSINSLVAVPGLAAYSASKFAVLGLAETLRLELADDGIGVLALLPGGMATTHLQSSDRARPERLGPAEGLDGALVDRIAAELSPTPESIVDPGHAIRNLIPALRDRREYLVTHGPIPDRLGAKLDRLRRAAEAADD